MAVGIDAQILIWGIKRKATPNRQHMIDRAVRFFEGLASDKQPVYLPTQALAEFLAGQSQEEAMKSLTELRKTFILKPFDAKAALVAAEIQRNWDALKGIMSDHGLTKQHIKADITVLSTAIAFGASHFYSEDRHIAALAKLASGKIIVAGLPAPLKPADPIPPLT